MKTIALALLVAACATASADSGSGSAPAPRMPPRPPPTTASCKPAGAVLFEADHLVDPKKEPAWTTKLYGNGAWTTTPADPKATAKSGCLDKDAMEKIRGDLKSAPWTIVHNRMHCMAYSNSHVVYSYSGKKLIDARMCSADVLDPKSQKALDEILQVLAPAAPPQPSATDQPM